MLVLSRKIGEQIIIDSHITVQILSIKGQQVRIGISAPPTVPIDRSEVHERRRAFEDIEAFAGMEEVLS